MKLSSVFGLGAFVFSSVFIATAAHAGADHSVVQLPGGYGSAGSFGGYAGAGAGDHGSHGGPSMPSTFAQLAGLIDHGIRAGEDVQVLQAIANAMLRQNFQTLTERELEVVTNERFKPGEVIDLGGPFGDLVKPRTPVPEGPSASVPEPATIYTFAGAAFVAIVVRSVQVTGFIAWMVAL